MRIIDITGKKFNKLTAIKFIEKRGKYKRHYWLFRCDCGKEKVIDKNSAICGQIKSCGCININKPPRLIHGMVGTKFYRAWIKMKERCLDKKNNRYYCYGGRGIMVCDSWLESFENFRDDMYKSYQKHIVEYGEKNTTLEKMDNNDNYCPENCRWATLKEQANNKRSNILIKFNNEKLTIAEWANKIGIRRATLYNRIVIHKWPTEKALTKIVKQ